MRKGLALVLAIPVAAAALGAVVLLRAGDGRASLDVHVIDARSDGPPAMRTCRSRIPAACV